MRASSPKVTPVAKITRSHGKLGEVIIQLYPSYIDSLDLKLPVFIEYDKIPVPFFIEQLSMRSKREAIIKLDGIDRLELSDEIVGKSIEVDYLSQEDEELEEFEGFKLFNTQGKAVGIITNYYHFPNNPCVGVAKNEGEQESFMVPIHPDLIVSVDWKREEVVVEIPEGLEQL